MEQQILDKVNASGVGPQGLGGTVTALACAIEPFGTHIAGLRAWLIFPATLPVTQRASCKQPGQEIVKPLGKYAEQIVNF